MHGKAGQASRLPANLSISEFHAYKNDNKETAKLTLNTCQIIDTILARSNKLNYHAGVIVYGQFKVMLTAFAFYETELLHALSNCRDTMKDCL